ncbi:ATP-binding protein, partial [Vibrio anguillarum]|nr:ATP-binding protein [Vibrio anguillarum]
DFVLQLNSMYLAVFDNMRSVTKDQSDLLCRASTRAASAKRTLFTTTGLTGLSLHSPMVLNGIHDFVKESDLADRCLRIRLVPMATNKRRSEQDLRAELEAVLPEILGA